MFKIIITLATIIAIVSAQAKLHPNTSKCFYDIERVILHARSIVKSVNALNFEILPDIKNVIEEVQTLNNDCAGVPPVDIESFSYSTMSINSIPNRMCILMVVSYKDILPAYVDYLRNNMSLSNLVGLGSKFISSVPVAMMECLREKPEVFQG